jgi:hypothetical protein
MSTTRRTQIRPRNKSRIYEEYKIISRNNLQLQIINKKILGAEQTMTIEGTQMSVAGQIKIAWGIIILSDKQIMIIKRNKI